jgi:hypothetical protein
MGSNRKSTKVSREALYKDYLKYIKWNISAITGQILLKVEQKQYKNKSK